jgi:hypothetical protein
MIKKVKLVQLHEPLFLAGTNMGVKLITKSHKGEAELLHDEESDHIIVNYKGETAHIKNWASFNIDNGKILEVKQTHHAETAFIGKAQVGGPGEVFRTAQVSTPMDKVQGKPGRRPKYQGEESQGE